MKCMADIKEINIEILGVKRSMLILEAWKSPGNLCLKKGTLCIILNLLHPPVASGAV